MYCHLNCSWNLLVMLSEENTNTMDRHFADIILHHLVLMVLPELPLSPMTFSSYSTSSLVHMHSIALLISPTEGQRTLCLTLYLPWQHLFDPSAPALVDNNFQFTPSHNPWRVHFVFPVPSSLYSRDQHRTYGPSGLNYEFRILCFKAQHGHPLPSSSTLLKIIKQMKPDIIK